jgi:hypothetical protein
MIEYGDVGWQKELLEGFIVAWKKRKEDHPDKSY